MTTAEISQGLEGNKKYQIKAREVLPILVRQAKAGKKIYYTDLAEEVAYSNPRNLNFPLGSIGTALIELSKEWDEEIPQIQCIVVNKSTNLPGEGIEWFISDTDKFSKLNNKQKNAMVDGLLAKIYAYDKWDLVLKSLGLSELQIQPDLEANIAEIETSNKSIGGGEGKEHKELKEFISNHPDSINLKYKNLTSETEKYLLSGDSVDVSFKNKKIWIGVEVKSKISNELDILRGLFQCIKYSAVMDSHLAVKGINKDTRVILALGCKFPKGLISIKNTLGVEVVDNIRA